MIQMTIQFNEQTGAINVNGPIANKVLCYGILEIAKQAIADFKPNDSKIALVNPPILVPKS